MSGADSIHLASVTPFARNKDGCVNAGFGDDSAHFIKNTVNPLTWQALNSIAPSEVLSADSF